MATTIRTFRTPSGGGSAVLVDTEVDEDDGDFSVTVPTSGWPEGTYDIQCTAQKEGESESALSNALSVEVVAPAGHSDAFTGTSGTALATHDSNWANVDGTNLVANAELDGSGNARSNGAWAETGGRYTASTESISQIIFKAAGTPGTSSPRAVVVRCNGTDYYEFRLFGADAGNYTSWAIWRRGTHEEWLAGGTYSGALNQDHTIRITATGTVSVTIHGYVDSIEQGTGTTDSAYPIASGNPGFWCQPQGAQNNSLVDNWQDT